MPLNFCIGMVIPYSKKRPLHTQKLLTSTALPLSPLKRVLCVVQGEPVCAALYRMDGDEVGKLSMVAAAPGEEGRGRASTPMKKLDQMQQGCVM